jgi:hypothetical protein
VRITAKTKKSSNTDIDGSGMATNPNVEAFFDGGNQNIADGGRQVYSLTALAVLPGGTQRILHYDVAPMAPITVDAAIHGKGSAVMGSSLNVSGFTDPACSSPSTYAVIVEGSAGTSGSGNLTGGPPGSTQQGAIQGPFKYNVPALIRALKPMSTDILTTGTGVDPRTTPTDNFGPHATLGVMPTVLYDQNGAITSVSADGTPVIYTSSGDLTLGTSTVGGAAVTGYGFLLVNGDLTIDITNGFTYFGLILVTGNVRMIANPQPSTSASIHGTIILGGSFSAPISNLSGSVFIQQNACMVQNMLLKQPFRVLGFNEIAQ